MALVKAVVDKVATNGTISSTRDEEIFASTVTRWGTRTVDEGEFKFSINTDIEMNDNLRYIQDIVPVDLLVFIHNFQLSTFDEGGYDHNPATDLAVTRFIKPNVGVNTKKFQSQYILLFDESTSTDFYDLATDARIDLSGQFDIYVWCQFSSALGSYGTGDNAYIWSSSTTGGDQYIELGFQHTAGSDKILAVRINNGSTNVVHTGSTDNTFINNTPRLIRVKRDENNDIKCYLNGALEITVANESADFGTRIRYGSHYHPSSPTEFWGGHIMQDRLYIGDYLTDDEADLILLNSPQPLTMKLSGVVSKVTDDTNPKKVIVRGNGRVLIDTNVTADILTGTDTSPDRTLNVYDPAEINLEIIEDIITNIDSSFAFKNGSSDVSAHIGRFIATGSFLQCVELLLLEGSQILYTNNKNIIVEDNDGISTPFKFEQGVIATTPGFIITVSAEDDALLVNQLELLGRLNTEYQEQTFTSGDSVTGLSGAPVTLRVEAPLGTLMVLGTDFNVNYEEPQVEWIGTAPANGTVFYSFEDVSSNDALYFRNTTTGSSSVTQYGIYDRRIFIPQLTDQEDFDQASQRIITDNRNVLTRYEVKAPNHCNHIRENHKILLVNSIKSINTTQIIKSISWLYPSMRTIIQLGEHRFDAFDMEKVDAQSATQASASTFKTHNS